LRLDKSAEADYTKVVQAQYLRSGQAVPAGTPPGSRHLIADFRTTLQWTASYGVSTLERAMDTHYPYHHSLLHQLPGKAMRPVCVYCLHLLGSPGVPLNASMRRSIEDNHVCVEKMIAREPHVSLPFN
jgi:hypothetical protein